MRVQPRPQAQDSETLDLEKKLDPPSGSLYYTFLVCMPAFRLESGSKFRGGAMHILWVTGAGESLTNRLVSVEREQCALKMNSSLNRPPQFL